MKNVAGVQSLQKQIPRIIGKHVYGNLYDIDEKQIADLDFLKKTVVDSAVKGNLHIIEMVAKKFAPYNDIDGGVSIIALIEESHIALHTWPESNYATLDIYSCGEKSSPEIAFKYIVGRIKPKTYKIFNADRSN
ncbi:adenosylmethionine decarboxylase [Candidatus Marsarchaeota archaeon]|jgi:S-adenosylmethionine decarboxylase|nr:adenosylmethionine decarboxylase [Candidatus Marsarchaeota archaeon]MCL5092244.1 adenosylmethionine decarboxylase [Candidatus Marsarchaeota archaeon]